MSGMNFRQLVQTLDEIADHRHPNESPKNVKHSAMVWSGTPCADSSILTSRRPHRISLDNAQLYQSPRLNIGFRPQREESNGEWLYKDGLLASTRPVATDGIWRSSDDDFAAGHRIENVGKPSVILSPSDWWLTYSLEQSASLLSGTADHWLRNATIGDGVSAMRGSPQPEDHDGEPFQAVTCRGTHSHSFSLRPLEPQDLYLTNVLEEAVAPSENVGSGATPVTDPANSLPAPVDAAHGADVSPESAAVCRELQQCVIELQYDFKRTLRRVADEGETNVQVRVTDSEELNKSIELTKRAAQQRQADAESELETVLQALAAEEAARQAAELKRKQELQQIEMEKAQQRQREAQLHLQRAEERKRHEDEKRAEADRLAEEMRKAEAAAEAHRRVVAEEEQQRQAAEEQKRSTVRTSPLPAGTQSNSLPPHVVKSLELIDCVRQFEKTEVEAIKSSCDADIANFRKHLFASLKKPLNQAGAVVTSLQRSCESMVETFEECDKVNLQSFAGGGMLRADSAKHYAYYLLSTHMMQDCDIDKQISRQSKSVWVYATLAATITRKFYEFRQMFDGVLFSQCSYAIPHYYQKPKQMSFDEFCRTRGGREGEGESLFFPRMASGVRLHLAFLVCCNDEASLWRWFSRILQLPPRRCTVFMILAGLETAGFYCWDKFGCQFVKILVYIHKVVFNALIGIRDKASGDVKEIMKDALAKLEHFLQEFNTNKSIKVPDGYHFKSSSCALSQNI